MSLFAIALFWLASNAQALDLDWHGQFRAETNWLWAYSTGQLANPVAGTDYGYFIPQNGDSPAAFQNLFFRLDPRVIVNDNVSLHSDIWLGTPDRGMFGGDGNSASTFYNTRAGSSSIVANEFYAEVATDFGTVTVGRAPLNWGLGLIWNNDKTKFDRLPSTGDTIGLVTKLGAFRFMPSITKYRMGSNYGGTAGTTAGDYTGTVKGSSGASDYSVGLSYTNNDEQIELGLLFLRRLAGSNSQIYDPLSTSSQDGRTLQTAGYAYNIWDFYGQKQAGIFTISAEVPLVTGLVASKDYSTVAAAAQVKAQLNDHWMIGINGGKADGQQTISGATPPSKLTAFYFHPDYRPGFLMFNYQYRNLASSSLSPYNNPITNARYLAVNSIHSIGKFSHELNWVYAMADQTADGVAGRYYFNTWDGRYKQQTGTAAQSNSLGWEVDYSLGYEWDESIHFAWETGLYFPGKFYEFSNTTTLNSITTIFGSTLNMMVKF